MSTPYIPWIFSDEHKRAWTEFCDTQDGDLYNAEAALYLERAEQEIVRLQAALRTSEGDPQDRAADLEAFAKVATLSQSDDLGHGAVEVLHDAVQLLSGVLRVEVPTTPLPTRRKD